MPNGYLYQKLEDVLRKYKVREEIDLDELSRELARRFRLTRKDIINILKELEKEKKALMKKRRKIFIELKLGMVRWFGWLGGGSRRQ